MNKYLAIIDGKTAAIGAISVAVTYGCYFWDIAYDINITLFSIAVVFPLVFTIREAFKRRDNALKFLAQFKSGVVSVSYSLEQCKKLDDAELREGLEILNTISDQFFLALDYENGDIRAAEAAVADLTAFLRRHSKAISGGTVMKIIRFVQDIHEGMENTICIKSHGTPISMRAYCLVFVFLFPFVFAPTIVYHLPDAPAVLTYGLAILHSFVLISLFNVQKQMENPFDQVGLDDIQLQEFHFRASAGERPPTAAARESDTAPVAAEPG